MCLQVSYKKKIWEKIFLASLKSLKKGVDPELNLDPDSLVRGMDPRIRNRTKMPRIPNTALHLDNFSALCDFQKTL
jgi:hypothetical protein